MTTAQKTNPKVDESTSVLQITPEMATRWLEYNCHNRKLNQALVDRFAQDMNDGRWRLTHQGIAFDEHGNLIDGQHRLWAIVLSGKTIPIRVFFDQSCENMACIDIGKSRSNLDVIKISGSFDHVNKDQMAILRAMVNGLSAKNKTMTVGQESQLLARHKDAIEFTMKYFYGTRVGKVTTASVAAVIARAYYSADHDKLIRFCEIMQTGLMVSPSEYVAILLWKYLYSGVASGRSERLAKYEKTERALKAFLNDEPITKLFGCDKELFPLPGEAAN